MKRNTEWHLQCLKNWEQAVSKESRNIEEAIVRLGKRKTELEFYRKQCMTAVEQFRDGFDSDRFLVVRVKETELDKA